MRDGQSRLCGFLSLPFSKSTSTKASRMIYLRPLSIRLCPSLDLLHCLPSRVLVRAGHEHGPDVSYQSCRNRDRVSAGIASNLRLEQRPLRGHSELQTPKTPSSLGHADTDGVDPSSELPKPLRPGKAMSPQDHQLEHRAHNGNLTPPKHGLSVVVPLAEQGDSSPPRSHCGLNLHPSKSGMKP